MKIFYTYNESQRKGVHLSLSYAQQDRYYEISLRKISRDNKHFPRENDILNVHN